MPPDAPAHDPTTHAPNIGRHGLFSLFCGGGKTMAWLLLALLALGGIAFLGWQHFYPAQATPGWSFSVFQDDLPMVSALAFDSTGQLYVTHEFRKNKGTVVRIDPHGERHPIADGLYKPDGLTSFQGGIAVSQEGDNLPVLLLRGGTVTPLFTGDNVEGLSSDGQRLFAIEDVKNDGRLLKYDPATRELRVLRDGLEEGEGVSICPNGDLYYTEKKKGWVKKYRPAPGGDGDPIVAAGLAAPGFLLCNEEGLWITEDVTHMARLLLLTPAGELQTILSHLRSAQTVIAPGPGRLFLAEQGRSRILEITRTAPARR